MGNQEATQSNIFKTYRKPIGHLEESDRTHRGNLEESYRKPKEDQEETQSNHIENI